MDSWFALERTGGHRRKRLEALAYLLDFFSMLLGAEIGFDGPRLAEHLRVLSDIFLRLVKVIIAPLILGTLISGIAGHGNLRSVGRIGLKSLICFELTTIALFIGVAAIDISRAGVGVSFAGSSVSAAAPAAAPMRWDDFVLHIFPENICEVHRRDSFWLRCAALRL